MQKGGFLLIDSIFKTGENYYFQKNETTFSKKKS